MDREARIAQLTLDAQLGLAFIALGGAIIGIAYASFGISESLFSSLATSAISELSLYTQYTSLYIQLLAVHNSSSNFTYNISHSFANLTKETNTTVNSTMSIATKVSKQGIRTYIILLSIGILSLAWGFYCFYKAKWEIGKLS
ncbi:MAG: hypothetical protein QW393_05010 [Candidatus Micrarchaeaceae archaeon]